MFAQPATQLQNLEIDHQADSTPHGGGDRDGGDVDRLYDLFTRLAATLDSLLTHRKPDFSTGVDFYEEVTRFEVGLIKQSLRLSSGSQVRAAKMLNLRPTTLNNKIKAYNIQSANTWLGTSYRKRTETEG